MGNDLGLIVENGAWMHNGITHICHVSRGHMIMMRSLSSLSSRSIWIGTSQLDDEDWARTPSTWDTVLKRDLISMTPHGQGDGAPLDGPLKGTRTTAD